MSTHTRIIMTGFLGLGMVMVFFLTETGQADETIRPPLSFNHKKHTALRIDCTACHTGAKDSMHAGIPPIDTCMLCHTSKSTNPKIRLLQTYAKSGKQIPWKRTYHLPDHARFSHERHALFAQIACTVCHGDVAQMEKPFRKQTVPMKMKNCIQCHQSRKVTTDCLSCHR